MNLLLLNYGQADNNSACHIFGHARAMAARGHDTCVSVAKSVPDGVFEPRDGFRLASQRTVLKSGPRFADGGPADILHAWTPRETVREFVDKYRGAWGCRALIIHLEDNETAIFERFTGRAMDAAAAEEIEWPKGLIHPVRHRSFLSSANGVTMVHRCLASLAPAELPRHELVPVMDFEFFASRDGSVPLRRALGISPASHVIAFNGNDHAAAALDIRQLYETVDILIERGRDVTFLRTGHVQPANYDGLQFRPGARCVEMGFIDRARVPEIMSLADVVIQPGDADAFNAFRLPAKVPEYLSMSKPLIMGAANIGIELHAASAALVLPRTRPTDMADAVEQLLRAPDYAREIGTRAREFALRRFNECTVAPALEAFYQTCLDGGPPTSARPIA
jgi:hypothetical protein